MQSPSLRSPVVGLLTAGFLGVLLAVATVGAFSLLPGAHTALPASTGAVDNSSSKYQNNTTAFSGAGAYNTTSGTSNSTSALTPSPAGLAVGDLNSVFSRPPTQNSSTGGVQQPENSSAAIATYAQQKSAVADYGVRDLAVFATAGIASLAAFFVARRRLS